MKKTNPKGFWRLLQPTVTFVAVNPSTSVIHLSIIFLNCLSNYGNGKLEPISAETEPEAMYSLDSKASCSEAKVLTT